MAEYLVIRLRPATDDAVQWIAVDDTGTCRSRSAVGSLEQAAVEAAGRPVIVLVPATEALTTTVYVPIRGGSRLRAGRAGAPARADG